MKICMITSYPPAKDGVGDVSVRLVAGIENVDSKSKVFVITHKRNDARSGPKIFRTITQKVSHRSYMQIARELKSLPRTMKEVDEALAIIEKINPDIVHAQYEPGLYNLFFLPLLFMKLKERKFKIVLTLHGRDYFPLNVFHKSFLYGLPDKIIVHTRSHEKRMKNIGIRNVETIPMGIPSIPLKGRFVKSAKSVFFFGYLSPHKGVSYLVRAFKKIVDEFPDAKLLIYGSVNPIHESERIYKMELENLIDGIGLRKNVEFKETYTPREFIPKIKSQIAVFPYAKSYSAGQSAALLDAISSGKAVIVTKVPGIYESVENGKTGFVIEPEDIVQLSAAIRKLFLDSRLVQKMGKENLSLAKKLEWKNIARTTLNLYGKLL